jgi:hypothetical protein
MLLDIVPGRRRGAVAVLDRSRSRLGDFSSGVLWRIRPSAARRQKANRLILLLSWVFRFLLSRR